MRFPLPARTRRLFAVVDRRLVGQAPFVAKIAIAAWLAAFLLVLATSCSTPQPSHLEPGYFTVIDLAKCPRQAVWFVRPAFRFRGVAYPADSTLAPDSVVDLSRCRR